MQSYHKQDFISFRVPKAIFSGGGSMEISSKPFCRLLAMRLGWDTNKSYRIPGRYFPSQKIVRFDLASAVEIRQDRLPSHQPEPLKLD